MSKRNVLLLISLVVALAAVVAVTVFLLKSSPEDESPQLLLVSDISHEAITAIAVTSDSGTIRVERQDGAWVAVDSDMEVDSLTCESMATYLSYVYAVDVVEEDAVNLSHYGLDEPQLTAELTLNDGSSIVFSFGLSTIDQSAVYFTKYGDNSVYTMRSDHFSQIRSTWADFVDLSLPVVDSENILSISYKRGSVEQTVLRSDVFESGFQFEQSGAPASAAFISQVKKSVKMRLNSYVGDEEKAEYGLDKDDFIRIADEDGTEISMFLGNKTKDGTKTYCTVDGKPGVYLVDEAFTAFIVDEISLCMDKRLMPVAEESIVAILWQGAVEKIELSAADGTAVVNGQEMDYGVYAELMNVLISAKASGVIDSETGGLVYTLTVSLPDGSFEVKLFDYLKGFYALDYGNGPSLYIKADLLKALIDVKAQY